MRRGWLVGLGAVLVLLGTVVTMQGLGAFGGGGSRSGATFWAVTGPSIALIGQVVAAAGFRRSSAT